MEKYIGIYNNSSICGVDVISFDTDKNTEYLENEIYELKNTIEELESKCTENDKKFVHIFELTVNDYNINEYKYITSKILR